MKYLLRNPALVISSFVFGPPTKKTGWKSAVPCRFHLVEKRDHIFTLQFLVTGPFRRKGWDDRTGWDMPSNFLPRVAIMNG
jgi:hypothetical protein